MNVSVSLRKFPEDVHRRAKAQAALEGKTLSAFVVAAIEAALPREASPMAKPAVRR